MKQSLKKTLPIALAVCIAASCRKNDVQQPAPAKMPYLISTVQPTNFGRDSFAYTYTGNTLTGMDYYFSGKNGGFYKYIYNVDSSIVWWSWNTLPDYKQYAYVLERNNDKINSLSWKINYGSADVYAYKALFKYNGAKLDSVFVTEDWQGIFEMDTSWVIKPTYTGDDITDIKVRDMTNGNSSNYFYNQSYTYDNTPNSFALVNKNYWLLGYNYKNTETFNLSDAIITLSIHNVTAEIYNGTTTNYTTTKNAMGNVVASSGGGKFYLGYK